MRRLAFTSPDGPAGARPELVQPSGAPHSSALANVAELVPRAERFGLDGATSPIVLPLLAAPHEPGFFLWCIYANVAVGAGVGMDATLSFGDAQGAQTLVQSAGLGGPGIINFSLPAIPFYSAGLLPIVVTLTFGGAVGPPLSVDVVTSIALVG